MKFVKISGKSFYRQRRVILIPLLAVLFAAVLLPPFYSLLGRPLIAAAYEGRSFSVFNRMISDQARRPVEKYLAYGEELLGRAESVLHQILFILVLLFLFTLLPLIRARVLQSLALAALSLVLILTFAEILLRWLAPVDIYEITFEDYQPSSNPNIVIEPRPNAGEFNSDGLRDVERAVLKPPGVARVLVLGDSLAYGWRVKEEETYAQRLEESLNVPGARERFEVINLGVPGYRTVQIVERLKEKGLKYRPDIVIYGYWLDDVTNSGFAPFFRSPAKIAVGEAINRMMDDDNGKRKIKKALLGSQILRRIILAARDFYRRAHPEAARPVFPGEETGNGPGPLPTGVEALYREFRDRVRQGEVRDLPGAEPYYADYCNPEDFGLWDRSLSELSTICRNLNIPCLLVMTPVLSELRGKDYPWTELHRFIAQVAETNGLPVLDLREEFEKYPVYSLRGGDLEHPNAFGHRIIAEKLKEWICAKRRRFFDHDASGWRIGGAEPGRGL